MKLTAAQMEEMGMSPDEMEAYDSKDVMEDDEAVEPTAAPAPAASGEASPAPAAAPVEDEGEAAPAAPAPAAEEDSEEAAEGEAVPAAEGRSLSSAAPEYKAPEYKSNFDKSAADAKLAELAAARADLDKKYNEGELDATAYMKQFSDLKDVETEIKIQASAAELTAQLSHQNRAHTWEQERDLFFNEHPEFRSGMPNAVLQAVIREVEAGEGGDKLSDRAVLQEAYRRVAAFQGKDPDAVDKPKKPSAMKASPPPQTLGATPASAPNAVADDMFAKLDDMEGVDAEEAMSRLSPADREKYLARD